MKLIQFAEEEIKGKKKKKKTRVGNIRIDCEKDVRENLREWTFSEVIQHASENGLLRKSLLQY